MGEKTNKNVYTPSKIILKNPNIVFFVINNPKALSQGDFKRSIPFSPCIISPIITKRNHFFL